MALKPFNGANGISVGQITPVDVIDANGNVTTSKFTSTGIADLGAVSNVKISNGSSGQVLSTDGAGNLSWVSVSTSGGLSNGTSNVSIPAANGNVNVSVAGNANIAIFTGTGVNVSGTLNATGNANVGNLGTAQILATANVTAPQLISNVATGTAPFVVTSNTVVTNLNADLIDGYNTATANTANTVAVRDANGNISANFFVGNGSQLTGIITSVSNVSNGNSNLSIPAANGNVNVSVAGNANVLVITGTGINVAGTLNATGNANVGNIGATNGVFTNVSGNGANLASITGSNVTGQVANALVAGTVYTNAQPNITSVGTLTALNVTGNVNAGNVTTGSGSGGSITGANLISANFFTGTLTTNSQPNITSVGTLTTLNVSGDANTGNLGTTTLIATTGNIATINSGLLQNGNSNITITANGNISFSTAGTANDVIITSTGVNVSGTGNFTGNLSAANLLGPLANGNSNVRIAAANGNVTLTAVGNTTMIVTGTGANITGTMNVSSNANVGNLGAAQVLATANVTAPQLISNIATGTAPFIVTSTTQVANLNVANAGYATSAGSATTAGTVTTNAQPNITSVGTLTGLAVSGNVDVTGNINVTGNLNYSNVTDLVVGDPLIYIGANNTGDVYDLGIVGSYNNGTYQHTGIARNATTDYWTFFDGVVAEPTTVIDWANATYPTVKLGNLIATGTANITGNANVGNLGTSGVIAATGNITGGNLKTTGTVSAMELNGTSDTWYYFSPDYNASYIKGLHITGSKDANGYIEIFESGIYAYKNAAPYNEFNFAIDGNSYINVATYNFGIGTAAPTSKLHVVGNANITGNANVGNIGATRGIFTNIVGEGGNISNIQGANVSGAVSSATTAGTVTTNAQPNITSVSTSFTNLTFANAQVISGNNITITTGANTNVGTLTGNWVLSAESKLRSSDGNASNILYGNGVFAAAPTGGGGSSISNGTSNVNIATANGNITMSVGGTANVATITTTSVNRGTYELSGFVYQANTAPSSPRPGDQWYNTNNGILFEYLNDGTTSQWVDVGSLPTPVIATANATAVQTNAQSTGTYYPAFVSSTADAYYSLTSNSSFSANLANGSFISTTFVGNLVGTTANLTGSVYLATTTGNVGIGTTSAATTLTIRTPHATATPTTYTGGIVIHDEQNGVAPHLGLGIAYNGGVQHSWIQSNDTTGVYPLLLNPAGGNIGIANSSPAHTLSVTGTASISGNVNVGNLIGPHANGNTTVNIPAANGNINFTAVGNTTMIITGTGANITGTLNTTGNVFSGNLSTGILTSNASVSTSTTATISAGTLTLNLNTSTIFDVTLNSNITTLTISNVQATGKSSSFVLQLTADGTARTIVWPASFRWPNGTAPTITSTLNKVDVIVAYTDDGGTNWFAFISGQNM